MQLYLPVAEITLNLYLLIGIGLAIGFLSGVLGIGGGFLMTPLLIFMGVPPPVAVGTGASQVVASSVSSALGHWQRSNVDLKMGLILIAAGLVGATTGIKILQWLKALGQLDLFINFAYVVMLGSVGGLMLVESINAIRKTGSNAAPVKLAGRHNWLERLPFKQRFRQSKIYISVIPPIVIGAVVGLLTAIMGVGGGFIMVPALVYLLHMPTRIVIGTSVFQIAFVTSYTTVLQSTFNQSVDIMLGTPLMLGGVIGAQYGVRVAQHLKPEQLRALLALLVLMTAIKIAFGLLQTPGEFYTLFAPHA